MILRLAAALAVVLGVSVYLVYLNEIGKGPWADPLARHLRAMKDRVTAPASFLPMTFSELAALPRRAPLSRVAPLERHGVVLEGYVQRMLRAPDDDIHLDLAPATHGPGGGLIPFISAEIPRGWRRGGDAWGFDRLAAVMHPEVGTRTRWDSGPRRVRLAGWLCYDYAYEGARPRAPFPPHLASWEIHPVTRIEVWDAARDAFVEIPR